MNSSNNCEKNRRILVIDDSQAIHDDFHKILSADFSAAEVDQAEAALFGTPTATTCQEEFQVDSALQGEEGLRLVQQANAEGRPYALAFVDVRMPPGWDGIETIGHLWQETPDLQVVICTAYSDYSWAETIEKLGQSDRLLILKKPFDNTEVRQLASALTEKWNLTRNVRLKMEDLEDKVKQRTAQLETQKQELQQTLTNLQRTQSQLLQADKMASIGQLAAGVAHEINNPIGFISSNLTSLDNYLLDIKRVLVSYGELLDTCRGGDDSSADLPGKIEQVQRLQDEVDLDFILGDLSDLITESNEGAHRVRQIVADLRDFSHVDSPDVSVEDINQLLDKTINVAWNELKYKTKIVREYSDVPALPCHGGKLGQVFLNLLVNAAQAIAEQGTITIRTGADDEKIFVEIADTGSGITPENINRIFDPFFTTKEVGKGTGLGLNLAYKIIQAHGGQINVHSESGQGTTFRIELPIDGPPDVKEKGHELAA